MLIVGDIVRIQPNHISFRSVKALEDIHGNHGLTKKGDLYLYLFRAPGSPESLTNIMYIKFPI
jgi:hypothetical protein